MKFVKVVKAGWKSDMDLTVGELRYMLELVLEKLNGFDDEHPCEHHSDTHDIEGDFIGIPSWGYIDLSKPIADEKGE